MSYSRDAIFEEWLEEKRKKEKAKRKKIDADSGKYDDRTVYSQMAQKGKRMPIELNNIRYLAMEGVIEALEDPAYPPLARDYIVLVQYVESVMDGFRPIADIMYDNELEASYQAIVQENFGNDFDFTDTTEIEEEE